MRRRSLVVVGLILASFAAGPARADFFAETAVQTHRGTHLDEPSEYDNFGVFEAKQGLGQTSTTTQFDFVDDVVIGPPPGIPIREESAFGSADLTTANLRASISGARRSGVFAQSRALAAIKDRMVVGRTGGPPFGSLNNDVVTFTLTIDGTIAVANPTPGSAFNSSIVSLVIGKPGSITPFLAFRSPDYLCTFYYGIGADAAVNYFNGPFIQSLPLVTRLTAFPATVTATCPVSGDFDWGVFIRPSYAATAVDTFWDFDFASTLSYEVSIANGGFVYSTDSGITPPAGQPAPPAPPIDHFLSYKTKATKGSTCVPSSDLNRNRACTNEEDCGGITDETTFCVPDKFPKGLRVTLSDRLEPGSRLYDVKKPITLCTPAQKYDEPIHDSSTHLRAYAIALTPKQCVAASFTNASGVCTREADCGGDRRTDFCQAQQKSVKQPGVTVRNQFHSGAGGALEVDVVKPDRLLVPTSKGLTEPLDPPGAVDVDHYKCYTVAMPRGVKFTPRTGVEVQDQFTQVQPPLGKKLFDLKKPTHLCMAATKNAESVVNPTRNLLCYQAVPAKGEPKHEPVKGLYLSNQFDAEQADTVKEEEFCVPSEVDLPAVS